MPTREKDPARARRAPRRATQLVAVVCGIFVLTLVSGIMPGVTGMAVSAALPWLGLLLLPLTLTALVRARRTLPLVLVAAIVWAWVAHPSFPAAPRAGSHPVLVVASQNVHSDGEAARQSALTLLESNPDVVVLTELPPDNRWAADEVLGIRLPHRFTVGTLSLWSAHPLNESTALELGLGWKRALRVSVAAPRGDVVLYGVHAASVRLGHQSERDDMLHALGEQLGAETADRVVVVGDFNAASTDPALGPIREHTRWVPPSDGTWGLSWPADFPVVRLDHVFVTGLNAATLTIRAGSSDHLATVTQVSDE